ncbi:MAG: zinc-dependent alcohol dehydrogenase family protein [Bacteroidales bacterium]|nr:zinc-dependent alcohol dehydrogenase family protein [Bacteroidales bacterium]
MRAMVLRGIVDLKQDHKPLEMVDWPAPEPLEGEVLLRVSRCGVCHTELDEIEGRTPPSRFPIIPGHQVVGYVERKGKHAARFSEGDRLGVAWIYSACGRCKQCRNGNENLCEKFKATGKDKHGGYTEYMVVPEEFAYPIPDIFNDSQAAPLLCAGAIGYRSLRLTNLKDGHKLGLTGFGASGHLVLQMAQHAYPKSRIYVFARNPEERKFARQLGAAWTGDTTERAPGKLDAIIDTTPVWKPVVEALRNLDAGGRLVINAIRKEHLDMDYLMNIDYPRHLWLEKEIKSVANVARRDVSEFLELAAEIPIKPDYQEYPLEKANQALLEIKQSKIRGAKVLKMD